VSSSVSPPADERRRLLRHGLHLAVATVSWNIVEGLIAITAGTAASSVALVVFGVDSFIETASGVVLTWRLGAELRAHSPADAERIERRAARIAGALLLGLALYVLIDAGIRLFGWGPAPHESLPGMILTALSLVIMPVMGAAKLRTARQLGSRALRADAYETITCAWLSFATLGGLALNAGCGWWWADPLAALLMLPLIVREGWEGWRGGCSREAH
jgi:divalent metal cation (Fe/Co/Zn/Cd) transporter